MAESWRVGRGIVLLGYNIGREREERESKDRLEEQEGGLKKLREYAHSNATCCNLQPLSASQRERKLSDACVTSYGV